MYECLRNVFKSSNENDTISASPTMCRRSLPVTSSTSDGSSTSSCVSCEPAGRPARGAQEKWEVLLGTTFLERIDKPSGCLCTDGHLTSRVIHRGSKYRRVPTPLRSTSPFSESRPTRARDPGDGDEVGEQRRRERAVRATATRLASDDGARRARASPREPARNVAGRNISGLGRFDASQRLGRFEAPRSLPRRRTPVGAKTKRDTI